MKLLLAIIIALALAALIGTMAGEDNGYMVLSFAGGTIQTSANTFFICLILFFIVFYFLLRFLFRLFSAPGDYQKYRQRKNVENNANYLTDGMNALIEGDWRKAENLLIKGVKYSENPVLNYLGAARAAQQLGAMDRRDEYLSLAYSQTGRVPPAVAITQAKLQYDLNQKEQALATLTKLHEDNPGQPEVNRMLLTSYVDTKEWDKVLGLLPRVKKQSGMTADMIKAYELKAYAGQLERAGALANEQRLSKVWLSIPRKYRGELFLIDTYVQQRLQFEHHQDSELLLRKAIKKQWDDRLIELYGLVEGNTPSSQLAFAEGLLSQYPNNASLLLTLGRLCLKNELWGKAREYFEDCVALKPSPEIYYELAQLLQHQLDEPELAANYHRQGLAMAAGDQPTLLLADQS